MQILSVVRETPSRGKAMFLPQGQMSLYRTIAHNFNRNMFWNNLAVLENVQKRFTEII